MSDIRKRKATEIRLQYNNFVDQKYFYVKKLSVLESKDGKDNRDGSTMKDSPRSVGLGFSLLHKDV